LEWPITYKKNHFALGLYLELFYLNRLLACYFNFLKFGLELTPEDMGSEHLNKQESLEIFLNLGWEWKRMMRVSDTQKCRNFLKYFIWILLNLDRERERRAWILCTEQSGSYTARICGAHLLRYFETYIFLSHAYCLAGKIVVY
jgi:hypothetical protein